MAPAQMTVDPDALYQSYDKNLYRITGDAESDAIMQMMQAEPNADNSQNVQVSASDMGSGIDTSTTVSATGSYQAGKKTFTNTDTGFILGLDPKDGYAKFYIGNSSQYLNWTGTALVVKGSISASSIDIPDTVTTASFHVDSSGNAWWGATTLAGSTASITAAGVATFAGLSTLNKQAGTNFETAARFVSTTGGTGANTFGNQGVTISPGATGNSFSKLQWKIGNVFTNNPTFTCTVLANSLHAASNSGVCWIGLGAPTLDGTSVTYNTDHIGVVIQKSSGTVTVSSEMNDSAVGAVGASLTTISDGDVLELFVKVLSSSKVQWYYRKNGGTITLGDTKTTHIPTGTGEDAINFYTSNQNTATDFSLILQCAAYEH